MRPHHATCLPAVRFRCVSVQLETIPMYNYPNFLNIFTTFMCEL